MAAGLKVGDRVACITNLQRGIVVEREGRRAKVLWGRANGVEYARWVPVVELTLDEDSAHLPGVTDTVVTP